MAGNAGRYDAHLQQLGLPLALGFAGGLGAGEGAEGAVVAVGGDVDGVLAETVHDLTTLWRDDFVAFALGCSFTFEHALEAAGIPLWHIAENKTVPMFASSIQTVPAGPFGGQMVVSMRAIADAQLDEVIAISKRFPMAHGAPLHIGDPAAIGIADITAPDWGDPAPVPAGTTPVFWACGVTPQVAITQAKPPICITHKPGHMLITDVADDAETTIIQP